MLDDFLKSKLYLKVDDTSDETIQKFVEIIDDIEWIDLEPIDSPFIRKLKDKYIYISCGVMFFRYTMDGENKKIVMLTEFVNHCLGNEIKFKDVDVMNLFAGEYDA